MKFFWHVLHGRANTLDLISAWGFSLVGSHCCTLHASGWGPWSYPLKLCFCLGCLVCFLWGFSYSFVSSQSYKDSIEELLKGYFWGQAGVCYFVRYVGARNNRIFMEGDFQHDVWSFARLSVSILVYVSRPFCNFSLCLILLYWSHFLKLTPLLWVYFIFL